MVVRPVLFCAPVFWMQDHWVEHFARSVQLSGKPDLKVVGINLRGVDFK
jgi:hypothetical protein